MNNDAPDNVLAESEAERCEHGRIKRQWVPCPPTKEPHPAGEAEHSGAAVGSKLAVSIQKPIQVLHPELLSVVRFPSERKAKVFFTTLPEKKHKWKM